MPLPRLVSVWIARRPRLFEVGIGKNCLCWQIITKMDAKNSDKQQVQVNFELHPPIEDDLDGATTLLRQNFLHFADCSGLARYLIKQKEVTQVVAVEAPDEENTSEDEEPDNDIYGLSSIIELPTPKSKDADELETEARRQLLNFLKNKCPRFKDFLESEDTATKIGLIVNERYINLPPQLALPQMKSLTEHIDQTKYSHLAFFSKILLRAKQDETRLPNKKTKSGGSSSFEPIIYVNPEEEIIFEGCEYHEDIDVSQHCDENASWSTSSDAKYIPHRRIMIVDYKKWQDILMNLSKELKAA